MAIDYSGMSNPSTGQNWSSSLAGGSGQNSLWQSLFGGAKKLIGGFNNIMDSKGAENIASLAGAFGNYQTDKAYGDYMSGQLGIQRENQDIYAEYAALERKKNLYMLDQTTQGQFSNFG